MYTFPQPGEKLSIQFFLYLSMLRYYYNYELNKQLIIE
jgi:hypothetical protein